MKKLSVLLLLAFATMGMTSLRDADPARLELEAAFEAYRAANLARNADAMMSFVYPGFFIFLPRAKIEASIREMVADKAAPRTTAIELMEISPLEPYGKGQFAHIKYTLKLELVRPGDATPQIDQMVAKMMKTRMGPDTQIVLDEQRDVFLVTGMVQLLALKEGEEGWKMIKVRQLPVLLHNKALPEDLAAKLQ